MSLPPDPGERGGPYRRTNPGQEPAHYICTTPRPMEAPVPSTMTRYSKALERIVWTAIQAGAGVGIDQLTSGTISWRAIGYAIGLAALKVVVALNVGDRDEPSIP